MKFLIRLAFAGLLLIAVVLLAFYVAIDVIAGKAIEKGSRYALGVDTHVGFARVGLLAGAFRIGDLEIDNPPGFASEHLLTLGDAQLAVSLESLQQDVVRVPRFALRDVSVALEKQGAQTNYGVILSHLRRFEKKPAEPAPAAPGAEQSGKRFVVEELLIRDIVAHVEQNEALGVIGGLDVSVPEVRLTNVGGRDGRGVGMAELTNIIVKAIFASIARYGTGLPAALAHDLRLDLGGLAKVPIELVGSTTGAVLEQIPTPVGDAARGIAHGAGEALEGLGNLLGGGQRDD